MKLIVSRRAFLAMAILISSCALNVAKAQDQTTPPAASDTTALPPGIAPGSQTAEIVKLVQAGVDTGVISAYVANATSAFNLDADQIITLKDAGVPTTVINAMMDHDKNMSVAATTMPAPVQDAVPAPVPTPDTTTAPPQVVDTTPDTTDIPPDTAPPPPVTVDYFNQNLNPYGSWIVVNGYGRCWRPTTVIYDPNWRPYCDRGRWVYTDCGWYWDSDYSWGVTFHYGRWFRDTRFGWCWYPDTQWAPSWVTWRSSDDYCGWAPLPPFAVFRPGAGFFYRGVVVGVNFDFGLGADYFTFITPDRFCDPHPRSYFINSRRGEDVFRRTTVINHFDARDRFVVNAGIPVERFGGHGRPAITPVTVGSLPTARREGWRGNVQVPQHMGPGNPGRNGSSSFNNNGNVNNRNGGFHTSNNNNNNVAGSHPSGTVYNGNPANNQGGHFANQPTGNSHGSATGGQTANTTTGNNTAGSTQSNNRNWNNGTPANGGNFHAPNPNNGNSSAHYSSPSGSPGTPVTGGNGSAGVTPANNGGGANNHTYHVQSQGPTTGNSSARYTSPGAPVSQGSTVGNNNVNVSHSPTAGMMTQRAEQGWPRQQNNYQAPSYNNNATVAERVAPAPRVEATPPVTSQPPQHSSGAAYSAHNNGGSSSGNSGSGQGNQSRNSNNNQQNH